MPPSQSVRSRTQETLRTLAQKNKPGVGVALESLHLATECPAPAAQRTIALHSNISLLLNRDALAPARLRVLE